MEHQAASLVHTRAAEGWEALLSGMIRGGWTITGSWPIATEMATRLRARESAALATSVHLICHPRVAPASSRQDAGATDSNVGDCMVRLQGKGVRGADLVFACIGPALEIFSRYAKVETADGREVPWKEVGRSWGAMPSPKCSARSRRAPVTVPPALSRSDARLTALFLWRLQGTHGEDVAENEEEDNAGKMPALPLRAAARQRASQVGTPDHIETKKGVVRLLPIAERAKQLFGADGAQAVAARIEQQATSQGPVQLGLFPETQPGAPAAIRGRGRGRGRHAGVNVSDESLAAAREATALDRVHAAMLLQAGGRTNALRALLKAEQERGPEFLRLANALSALYAKGSEEKRLLDAMLLATLR